MDFYYPERKGPSPLSRRFYSHMAMTVLLSLLALSESNQTLKKNEKEHPVPINTQDEIVIYIKPSCPFCRDAIRLLRERKLDYTEINIQKYPDRRAEMIEKAHGRTTVPQIFFGKNHIGGYTDLAELDSKQQLK